MMEPDQLEALFRSASSLGSSLFLLGCCVLIFRSLLVNIVAGLIWRLGTLTLDSPLRISSRPSRYVRSGCFRTTFYMLDTDSRMIVPNSQLSTLTIELALAKNAD